MNHSASHLNPDNSADNSERADHDLRDLLDAAYAPRPRGSIERTLVRARVRQRIAERRSRRYAAIAGIAAALAVALIPLIGRELATESAPELPPDSRALVPVSSGMLFGADPPSEPSALDAALPPAYAVMTAWFVGN